MASLDVSGLGVARTRVAIIETAVLPRRAGRKATVVAGNREMTMEAMVMVRMMFCC